MSVCRWIRWTTRDALYKRDCYTCVYCGKGPLTSYELELDHVIPRSAGGVNSPGNLFTCCRECNGAKRSMSLGDYMTLLDGDDTNMEHLAERLARAFNTPLDRAAARADIRAQWGRLV